MVSGSSVWIGRFSLPYRKTNKTPIKTKAYQDKNLSRLKTKAEIKIKVKTSQDFVGDRYHIHGTALVPLFAFCRTMYLSTCNTVGNICIYNIVYVVYCTAVDGLSGLMFGGLTSRTPPSLYCWGGCARAVHACSCMVVKSSTYGDWEDPACGAIECVG